jgi:hypothetical protein
MAGRGAATRRCSRGRCTADDVSIALQMAFQLEHIDYL